MKILRLWCVLLPVTLSHAAERPGDFAFYVPIAIGQGSGLARVQLPQAVYEGSVHPALGDLRVFDGKGNPVPFALEPPRDQKAQGSEQRLNFFPMYSDAQTSLERGRVSVITRGKDVSVQVHDDVNTLDAGKPVLRGYLLDLSSLHEALTALRLDWQAGHDNGMLLVSVEGSDDLDLWRALVNRVTLAKLQANGQNLVRDTLEFESAKPKYMRVIFAQARSVISITAIYGRKGESTVARARSWKSVTGQATDKAQIDFDLGGPLPVDRLQLVLPGSSTVVPVDVFSKRNEAGTWNLVARHNFYRIAQESHSIENPELVVPVTRYRYWRVAAAQSQTSMETVSVRVGWVPENLIFVVHGEGPFKLAYGRTGARSAILPIESVVPGYGTDRAPGIADATAGGQQVLAGPAAQAAALNYKVAALWGVLGLGVALMGWMAWSLMRQMKA